ncbi:hypothetical protein M422DRAFT_50730 [Sphaerobolus stellatus SS14]|uniref:SUZ domain-containing protein n=1 Tax=Sphaerobolus stellatus (strain SS14) TaxID=990650 RepID=A0A0C9VHU8_SPHS4|nr:hypothetical protein M422DRAFT_50730 [Sphaerobolus stellatus SS14]
MDVTFQAIAKGNTEVADDAWDQSLSGSGQVHSTQVRSSTAKTKAPVRDAWDDDDDDDDVEEEDREANEPDSKELWEKANTSTPLPSIQLSTSTTSPVALPPVAALQGPLRILKRPSATSSSTSTSSLSSNAQSRMTLQEREAQYQAARARIFGGAGDGVSGTGNSRSPSPKAASGVIREPIGPSSSGDNKQGFSGRRKKVNGVNAPSSSGQATPKEGTET